MDRQCAGCQSTAIGWVRVPSSIHPDEKLECCGDCAAFVRGALDDIRHFDWLAGELPG